MDSELQYATGFGNHIESEAVAGALPAGQNAPQQVPFGLYAEQLSGTAFTASRHQNLRSWLYRIRPSVLHSDFRPVEQLYLSGTPFTTEYTPPTQMRWDPLPYPETPQDFIQGLFTVGGNGDISSQQGAAIHLYCVTASMTNRFFYNSDGDFLIVPQEGRLRFKTEFGLLDVSPGEIVVIQRGIKYQVELLGEHARGYICENYGSPFKLPDLGVIGANGLANPRDFKIPTAAYSDNETPCELFTKFLGRLYAANLEHSPLDVVAWHGNYVPYKYDLALFNTINTVSYDHPDPSIFTVLTSASSYQGIANVDFVIFPPRWMVAENSFRPPYYHRNIMSEFMGLIYGNYDAKETGFVPGGASLHNCMSAHGPDANAHHKAVTASLQPEYYANTLAFMFESRQVWQLTPWAYQSIQRQQDYLDCWKGLKKSEIKASLT